tara:strand:- start:5576 stop:6058 length:483 start_codon:yes stop_codon:yes gene_type:complete
MLAKIKLIEDRLRNDISLESVKSRIQKVETLSASLWNELNRVDGHTWDLIAKPGFDLNQFMDAVSTLRHFASQAEERLPSAYSGKKRKSAVNVNLAVGLAKAMSSILGVEPSTGPSKPFSKLLVLLLFILGGSPREGVDPFTRDVRRLVKEAIKVFRSEL